MSQHMKRLDELLDHVFTHGTDEERAAVVDELRRGLAIVREFRAPRLQRRDEAWLRARLEELRR